MMKIGLALSTANHGNFFWEGLKRAKHITYWCGVVDSLVALIKTAESLGMSTSLNEELGKKNHLVLDNEKIYKSQNIRHMYVKSKKLAFTVLKCNSST